VLDDDLAAHILDYFRCGAAKEDMMTNNQKQTYKKYQVTVNPPKSEQVTYTVHALNALNAKTEASLLYYGHVFTGQYQYMRVQRIKEEE